MAKTPSPPPTSLHYAKMLFLASHGLQTPLSAIRWGAGRLKRMGRDLPPEYGKVIDNIHAESRLLSQMFDMLLLLAKVEEGAHQANVQEIFLRDFLHAPARNEELPRPIVFQITCPDDLRVRADRTLLEAIIHALFLVATVGSEESAVSVTVVADERKESCDITLTAPLKLSLLDDADSSVPGSEDRKVVGGVPGFLLGIAASLCQSMGGSLMPLRQGEETVGLVFRLPLQPLPAAFG